MESLRLIRSIVWTIPVCVLITTVLLLLSLCALPLKSGEKIADRLFRTWARWVLYVCRVKVNVIGAGNIEPRQSYVFGSNHASYIDVPILIANMPARLVFLAKEELFRIPLLGTYLRTRGHIPVRRSSIRASAKALQTALHALTGQAVSLVVFPEGTRSATGLAEFKEGGALIATRAGFPIVPVGLCGTGAVLPPNSLRITGATVELRIGPPMSTPTAGKADHRELTKSLRAAVEELLS